MGVHTVLRAIPPSGPLSLGRYQGVGLCVIVQVLLAAPTSMRAKGREDLVETREGWGIPSPAPD